MNVKGVEFKIELYLGDTSVAVVAPDWFGVATPMEGTSVIPSLSCHGGREDGR